MTDDTLGALDFASMLSPTFTTAVSGWMIVTTASSFPGVETAWERGDPLQRRQAFLHLGNAHLAEVQVAKLDPEDRTRLIETLPESLPTNDVTAYTRMLAAAVGSVGQQAPSGMKLPQDQLEAYRRCLLVRAVAYGGSLDLPLMVLAERIVPMAE